MKIKTLEETLQFLKTHDISSMDLNLLEEHICSFGLNNEVLSEQPKSLSEYYGKGLLIWQYPNQFAPFIKWLSNIKIDSYLEIGCRFGGTFIIISEILKKNNPNIRLIACDLIQESLILKEYKKYTNFEYLNKPSGSLEFDSHIGKNIDMVFIDGDHSYSGCMRDWLSFKDNPEVKYIIFHDIHSNSCPAVGEIWKLIKKDYALEFEFNEFVDQYPSEDIPQHSHFLGIGTATRKIKN